MFRLCFANSPVTVWIIPGLSGHDSVSIWSFDMMDGLLLLFVPKLNRCVWTPIGLLMAVLNMGERSRGLRVVAINGHTV